MIESVTDAITFIASDQCVASSVTATPRPTTTAPTPVADSAALTPTAVASAAATPSPSITCAGAPTPGRHRVESTNHRPDAPDERGDLRAHESADGSAEHGRDDASEQLGRGPVPVEPADHALDGLADGLELRDEPQAEPRCEVLDRRFQCLHLVMQRLGLLLRCPVCGVELRSGLGCLLELRDAIG